MGSGPAKLGALMETDDRLDLLILEGGRVTLWERPLDTVIDACTTSRKMFHVEHL
jgi:hypothetical protein